MPLIQCPECKEKISDKATFCPHCGYPMNDTNNQQLYSMVLVELQKNANIFFIKSVLEQAFGVPKGEATQLLNHPGSILVDGIKQCNIECLNKEFSSYKCVVKFVPSKSESLNIKNSEWEIWKSKKNPIVQCPRCGSTQITSGHRGFSFWTGFIGANKTVNRCANCGHHWTP